MRLVLVFLGFWGGFICSRCRILLVRRSNIISVWFSLLEMICRSSVSTVSIAFECSRRFFSRVGSISWVIGRGGEGY